LVDVAGIRAPNEASEIERIGIEKAFDELSRADAVIWLADCTKAEPFNDPIIKEKLALIKAPVIKVLNKADLRESTDEMALSISAELGFGIEDLKGSLHKLLIKNNSTEGEIFITRARQRDELIVARASLIEAQAALLSHMVDEVVSSELRGAGLAFDRLFGTTLAEDVLDRIFSQFCIGK
jgi:tRNA modification GTPase